MKNLKNSKKGSIQDLALIAGVIGVFAIMVLVSFTVTSAINDHIQSDPSFDANARGATQTLTDAYPTIIDNAGLLLLGGLMIIMLIFAALVRVHPIFIAIYLIMLPFVIILAAIISNVYDELAHQTTLAPYASQLTYISLICTYLPWIVGVFGIVLMVVMYKLRGLAE